MSRERVRVAAAAVASLTLAAPPPLTAHQGPASNSIRDGQPTAAACGPYGFELPGGARPSPPRAQAAPSGRIAPPAATLPIGPTLKSDRVEYSGPPVIVPGPPPPPISSTAAPPSPTRPSVPAEIVVTGSRLTSHPETERYPDAAPNPVRRVADAPVSTFSIDVDTASYANVRRFISEGRSPPADAVRVEELINYFDYDYPTPSSAAEPFTITTAIAAAPWAPGRQIVHVGLQGYKLAAEQRAPQNLTFLVDVSGSMGSPDKLALAQRAMNLLIDRLRPEDTVAVTYYAEGAGTKLPPTPGHEKLRIRCAVASLYASGGTAGATGLTNAYDQAEASFAPGRVNRILMFTDGDFNVGVTDNMRLEEYVARKRQSGIYLSVYGLGRGNYQDARMQTIAQAGNGVAAYIDSLGEARRLFGPMFDRGAFPIADDVKIQVEFNPLRVEEYRLIGYETRLLQEADFANDRVDAGEVGSGASVTALYEITPRGGQPQIPARRYARRDERIAGPGAAQELGFVQIRYKSPGGDSSQLIQQVIANHRATDAVSSQPPESTRWALAVAAFGQKLRGDPWLPLDYGWNQVLEQAQGARGADPFGERAEFVQLVRAAGELPPPNEP